MIPILEAVPNLSSGRDPGFLRAAAEAVEAEGAELLDLSSDPDHNRSVLTFIGSPAVVESAALALAVVAREGIDLRDHRGVHPRIGALDVLPFVPLTGMTLEDAVHSARRVARRLADEVGIPAYLYAAASTPVGRGLAELRRGGFEALRDGFPEGRIPDALPPGWGNRGAHETAGVTSVGARPILLAWNVRVDGIGIAEARKVAAALRERGGGFPFLRVLALELESVDAVQLSMNLERPDLMDPLLVLRAIEERIETLGGEVGACEVIGMLPDTLVLPAAADRLRLPDGAPDRLLSARLSTHLARTFGSAIRTLADAVEEAGDTVPESVRRASMQLGRVTGIRSEASGVPHPLSPTPRTPGSRGS